MPRPRTTSDEAIFAHALALMQERGSDALTFAALAQRSGLAGSTLVQRFGSKPKLIHAAMLHAWDAFDQLNDEIAAAAPRTPAGAIAMLGRLSQTYGDIEGYADQLHVLREDLRHPDLRERGHRWVETLAARIGACFADTPGAPTDIGILMVGQWQGALLLWGFSPGSRLDAFIRMHLDRFMKALDIP
ncbi:MAG: TetR/AcrR family transcriptional regulator [Pseudomonadota bacterium]|uniref:TetR/AcrR family transcriptional regulator n=1 Tax=Sphingomonas sp. ERG5 TaxID=1381597 RepID=UPI00054B7D6A|nr:TetR/AcrR family transcriptional regulator [Sphingomonas sp. ERG5]